MEFCQQRNLTSFPFENSRGIVDCHVKIGSTRSSDKGQVHVEYVSNIANILVKTVEDLGKRVKCTLVEVLRLYTGHTAHRRSRGIALFFLDHGTRRGKGSASSPGRSLLPGKTRYPLYCTGRWMSPRTGLDRCRKSRVRRDSIPGPSSPYPVAIPTELPGPHRRSELSVKILVRLLLSLYFALGTWRKNVMRNARILIFSSTSFARNILAVINSESVGRCAQKWM